MKEYIPRATMSNLRSTLDQYGCALLLGPRQVGKTVLARDLLPSGLGVVPEYLDLEQEDDRAKISEFDTFATENVGKLIIFDEAQCAPELFPKLRQYLDQREENATPLIKCLLLGSATVHLQSLTDDSLGGRFGSIDLTPFHLGELNDNIGASTAEFLISDQPEVVAVSTQQDVNPFELAKLLWLRGGFPRSFLSDSIDESIEWRSSYVQSLFGPKTLTEGSLPNADRLGDLWRLLVLNQGEATDKLSQNLGCKKEEINRLLQFLIQSQLVRKVRPWHRNEGKRLTKSPRIFIRDSGLLHEQWRFSEIEHLQDHSINGKSWEGFVLETLLSSAPIGTVPYFYRYSEEDEIDIILEFNPRTRWAIEVKLSGDPTVGGEFYRATEEVEADQRFVVHGGPESFKIGRETPVEALSLSDAVQRVRALP